MDLVRDVLDKKLIDREDCEMGRVDGLVMQFGEDSQPRITHIEIGGKTLWMRLHPVFARMAVKLARLWGPKRDGPVRIPWSRVVTTGSGGRPYTSGRSRRRKKAPPPPIPSSSSAR